MRPCSPDYWIYGEHTEDDVVQLMLLTLYVLSCPDYEALA